MFKDKDKKKKSVVKEVHPKKEVEDETEALNKKEFLKMEGLSLFHSLFLYECEQHD